MKIGPDKRSHVRVPLEASAYVLVGEDDPIEVIIGNISISGVLFHSNWKFKLGEILFMTFSGVFHEKPFDEFVLGKIVTVFQKESGNSYGLHFSTYLVSETQPFLTGFVNRTRGKGISFLRDPRYSRAERKE